MPDDTDDKTKPPAASAARAGSEDHSDQPYVTADKVLAIEQPKGKPTLGLSQSPGLVEVPDSRVPGLAGGGMVSHVMGPGQAPVDPIAAGLDTKYIPLTRNELRAPTQTGTDGAGLRPSTYAEKTEGQQVKQATEATHETTKPASNSEVGTAAVADAKPATDAVPDGKGAPIRAKPEGEPNVQ